MSDTPYAKAIDRIRELEQRISNLAQYTVELEDKISEQDTTLTRRSVELAMMGAASADTQKEDLAEISAYKEQNAALITFVQRIADTQSKFAKEAKALLKQ